MNVAIDGLTAEARKHFQGTLQLFLPTFPCPIFILPSVGICASQGRSSIYSKALCNSGVARCEEPVHRGPPGTAGS